MPEAKLAREAEITYAVVAMVTDFDCWHQAHGAVDVASVLRVMAENSGKARGCSRGWRGIFRPSACRARWAPTARSTAPS